MLCIPLQRACQLDTENRIIQQDFTEQYGVLGGNWEHFIPKIHHVELVGFCVEAWPVSFVHCSEKPETAVVAIH
jgi:hypothetical protein